jgi:protein TonB
MARALVLLRTTPDTLLERIARLSRHRRGLRIAVLAAAGAHTVLVSILADMKPESAALGSTNVSELTIELPAPKSVPEPPVEARQAPEKVANPAPLPTPPHQTEPAPAAPPREASRAAAVVSRSEESEQPLDFTDSIVTGTAASYAGGITRALGTGDRVSRNAGIRPAVAPQNSTAKGGESPLPAEDLSRAPGVLGGLAWNCPFPPAADVDGVNQAQVAIRVEVDALGRPTRVLILSDPGHGFAAAARACALGKRWTPGANRWGRASASGINLNVRFVR